MRFSNLFRYSYEQSERNHLRELHDRIALYMTRKFRRAAVTALVFFGCSLGLILVLNRPAIHAANADAEMRGGRLFQKNGCQHCHSIAGVGGTRGPDLASVGDRIGSRQIKKRILHGGGGMPPFAQVLTKKEVKDLAAFLSSCRASSPSGCRQWIPAQ